MEQRIGSVGGKSSFIKIREQHENLLLKENNNISIKVAEPSEE